MKNSLLLAVGIAVLVPHIATAQLASGGDVVINEIAWMGTTVSANDEWIELHNTTNAFIIVDGWTLKTQDEKIHTTLKGGIEAGGFYLLERTDDSSVPTASADFIYKGSLSNAGQYLKLYDSGNIIIDQANFTEKWPAGNSTTRQTMEKMNSGWQSSKDVGGTPRQPNSSGAVENIKPQISNPTHAINSNEEAMVNTAAPETVIEKTYPAGVVINEILPAPEGADDQYEWIELKNTTTTSISLANWKLVDTQGSATAYVFPENSSIAANGYLVILRPESKITLNNDADGLQLMFPNGAVTNSVQYSGAKTNLSYSKTNSGWTWSTTPTQNKANTITVASGKKAALSKTKKPDKTSSVAAAAVPLSEIFSEPLDGNGQNPWPLFLMAVAIAIICGVLFLLIKLFLFKKSNVRS